MTDLLEMLAHLKNSSADVMLKRCKVHQAGSGDRRCPNSVAGSCVRRPHDASTLCPPLRCPHMSWCPWEFLALAMCIELMCPHRVGGYWINKAVIKKAMAPLLHLVFLLPSGNLSDPTSSL